MPRYATVDIESGELWALRDADDPVEACRVVDEGLGAHGRSYTQHGPRSRADEKREGAADGGYRVHLAPVDADPDAVELDRWPLVAIVLYREGC